MHERLDGRNKADATFKKVINKHHVRAGWPSFIIKAREKNAFNSLADTFQPTLHYSDKVPCSQMRTQQ